MTTPTANWNVTTINGVEYLVIETAQFRIPLNWDPSSNMFIAVAAPNAAVPIGIGNFPALLTGPPGDTPTIATAINFTALAYSDPTPDSASWTEIGTDQYQLNLSLHDGAPGGAGTMAILSASDLANSSGTTAQKALTGAAAPTPGYSIVVNAAGDGFVFNSPRVGDRYTPAVIKSAPSGNALYTLAQVTIGPLLHDWRPQVEGQSILTPTGTDASVDLICRLSNTNPDGGATTGNDVGRAIGLPLTAATNQALSAGPPPASADSWDRVPAGQIATIFFNAERQTGSSYFTTQASTTRFNVWVRQCPTDLG